MQSDSFRVWLCILYDIWMVLSLFVIQMCSHISVVEHQLPVLSPLLKLDKVRLNIPLGNKKRSLLLIINVVLYYRVCTFCLL